MATIQNARDVLLQAAVSRLDTVAGPTNVTVDFAQVNGSTKPSNNADVTTSILTNSGTSIVMNNAQLFKSGSGLGGVFIGSGGLFGKDSGGTETFAIDAGTGAARFAGDINTTGNARFKGAYTGAVTNAAVYANESNTAATGVFGTSNATLASHAATGIGVWGVGTGTEAFGVVGGSNGGIGVSGATASGSNAGVRGNNTGGGPSVECVTTFKWNGYTYSAPAGSSTTCMHNDGVWRDPVTTARVNAAFGCSESDVLQIIATDSGTATVSGTGINLTSTIAGVRFRATGGNSIVLETF